MDPDQHPPRRVPAPRDGGRDLGGDGGDAWYPFVPAPRVAPDLERLPAVAAAPTARPEASTALVLVPRPASALAVSDAGVTGLLRAWGRAVARAVHAAVDGVRTVLGALVPTPAAR
ncbi:MAG TPA: hypothetical protein VNP37_16265 [Actinomycetospora sp.]|nr:hypothetical protein [Actinomycetospora sp.]